MRTSSLHRVARNSGVAAVAGLLALGAAAPRASAHQLSVRYESPLPLATYLIGAAVAVAASFALVLFRAGQAAPAEPAGRSFGLPSIVRSGLRAIGLIAWLWIAVQAAVGVTAESDAASLFGWVYGWVGLALVSAFVGPAWRWLDPFSTLFDILAGTIRRLRIAGMTPLAYPDRLGRWPAVAGFLFFVWLELAVPQGRGGQLLGLALLGYTAITLVSMSQFGRDVWRERGEVFSVWFGQLGRLAPLGPDPADPDRRLVRRPFASGLIGADWSIDRLVLVATATAAVIFDGLSQTTVWFGWFGAPGALLQTLLLAGWIALVAGIAVLTSRVVGVAALASGLVPIAAGYIVAHYLTYLLFDGQRLMLLVTDPLSRGSDLLHLGEFEPVTGWLAPGIVWAIQLLAIVGGHVTGAVVGHRVAVAEATTARSVRVRQVPLAILMVGLTTLTLWSLGQNIVEPQAPPTAVLDARPTAGLSVPLARS